MKSMYKLLAMVVVFCTAMLYVADLAAQTLNPLPCDCPDDFFGIEQTYIYTDPNGCQIVVHYRTRIACNTWFDLLITDMVWNPDDPNCTAVNAMGLLALMEQVTQSLLVANPMGFPLPVDDGDCINRWRLLKGSCWRTVTSSIGPNTQTIFEACFEADCCFQPYTICRDCNELIYSEGPTEIPGDDCPPELEGCEKMCR